MLAPKIALSMIVAGAAGKGASQRSQSATAEAVCDLEQVLRPSDLGQRHALCFSTSSPNSITLPLAVARNSALESTPTRATRAAPPPFVWHGPEHCQDHGICVYSHRDAGQGIVLVSTAENAEAVANIFSQSHPNLGYITSAPPFHTANVPGKGIGAIANRTIRRGEAVTMTFPAMLVQRNVLFDFAYHDLQGASRLLGLAVQKLPASRRRAVTRQSGGSLEEILMTNSFQLNVRIAPSSSSEDLGFHLGNFPEASRFNHDCRPNLAFYIAENLVHYTHAVRDIQPGEELTISYVNPLDRRAERQARLHDGWGFYCQCARCTASAEGATATSDSRINDIEQLEAQLGSYDASSTQSAADASFAVARLLDLYNAEGIEAKMGGAYTLAALQSSLSSDEKASRRYARLAAEFVAMELGPTAEDARSMRELESNPTAHWSWGKRIAK